MNRVLLFSAIVMLSSALLQQQERVSFLAVLNTPLDNVVIDGGAPEEMPYALAAATESRQLVQRPSAQRELTYQRVLSGANVFDGVMYNTTTKTIPIVIKDTILLKLRI